MKKANNLYLISKQDLSDICTGKTGMKWWVLLIALLFGISGAFAQAKPNNQTVIWDFGKGLANERIFKILRTSKMNLVHVPKKYGNFTLVEADTFSVKSTYDSVVQSFGAHYINDAIKTRITSDDLANAELHQDTKIRCDVKHHSILSTFFLVKESYDEYAFCMRDSGTNRFDPSFVFGEEQTPVVREILWKRFLISILIICFVVFLMLKDVNIRTNMFTDMWFSLIVTVIAGFICLLLFYDNEPNLELDVPLWQYVVILGPIVLASYILIILKKRKIRNSWKQ